ncbi:hypothetical protein RND61_15050 [Streptomyces sp. TRM76323]|uniref:Tail tube protein n=1 Tax=Streptomyces tamarix TaxID=3078565 RepID=A0ABU3QL72_9ACTN|nr:hypothetical protein [Streptomyces tamarix]MDT9683381.1 hypothetical protein [Streptomyces tamarix]
MTSLAKQTVHTGNTVIFSIAGKPVARAQSLSATRSYGTIAVKELGSIMVKEHVQTDYDGRLTVSKFRMRTSDLEATGFGSYGEDILNQGVIDITLVDSETKQVLESYYGCTIASQNLTVRVGEVVAEEVDFMYLSAKKNDIV